jgi:aspartate dehydrogenase
MTNLRVAIAGLGTIGHSVAATLDRGVQGLALTAIGARDRRKVAAATRAFAHTVAVTSISDLAQHADIIVECVPAAAFREVAEPAIQAGRIFLPLSVGALLGAPDLIELAATTQARIIAPTGALLGLDAVRAAAQGEIQSVKMITRKPPKSLRGAPFLEARKISIDDLAEPLRVFSGSAREGALGFPANVNVAAALSLAGIGPDRTRLEIWADPTLDRNTHRIEVEADSARFSMYIENVPSDGNPGTGRITALSVIACLRGLVEPLKIGS